MLAITSFSVSHLNFSKAYLCVLLSSDGRLADQDILSLIQLVREKPETLPRRKLLSLIRKLTVKSRDFLLAQAQKNDVDVHTAISSVLVACKEAASGVLAGSVVQRAFQDAECPELARFVERLSKGTVLVER